MRKDSDVTITFTFFSPAPSALKKQFNIDKNLAW